VSFRPDLVACWMFHVEADGQVRILLLQRAPGRIFPGMWQPVTGKLEPGERIVDGALRELVEETGIGPDGIEVLYGVDQVNIFHADHVDALQAEAVFAAELKPGVEATLSDEHDEQRWLSPAEASAMVVWPAYREAISQLEWIATHRDLARLMQVGAWAVPESAPPSPAQPPAPHAPPQDTSSR
jgi:8-oxo-dGTP pyrophosphatase MutT (NUDIX family)